MIKISLSFRKKVAKLVKLHAGFDLEMEIYKNAGSFDRAISFWVEHFTSDLNTIYQQYSKIPIAGDTIDINRRKQHFQWLERADTLAQRVDFILAHRSLQYTEIAEHYKLIIISKEEQLKQEQKTQKYLLSMKHVLNNINSLAKRLLDKKDEIKYPIKQELLNYLTMLSTLTVPILLKILKQGNIPFRYEN